MLNILNIILLLLLLNLPLPANMKKEIIWDIAIEPPITFLKNNKYEGYGIEIINAIQKEMPEYVHKIRIAGNYKRLTKDVNDGPLTCALGLFKTRDRLKTMYFSKVPVFSFFNMQIVLTKKTFEIMGEPKSVSLKNMLNMSEFKLGVSDGRTYSKKLRNILSEYGNPSNIISLSQSNVSNSLLGMLVRNRLDYMFLYPDEATYLSKKLGISNEIVTVPISEIDDFGHSWAVCTKNKIGKVITSKITNILMNIRKKESYINNYMNWISGNLHDYYTKNFKLNFLEIYEE